MGGPGRGAPILSHKMLHVFPLTRRRLSATSASATPQGPHFPHPPPSGIGRIGSNAGSISSMIPGILLRRPAWWRALLVGGGGGPGRRAALARFRLCGGEGSDGFVTAATRPRVIAHPPDSIGQRSASAGAAAVPSVGAAAGCGQDPGTVTRGQLGSGPRRLGRVEGQDGPPPRIAYGLDSAAAAPPTSVAVDDDEGSGVDRARLSACWGRCRRCGRVHALPRTPEAEAAAHRLMAGERGGS